MVPLENYLALSGIIFALGVYGVLWQIELARRLDLPYLYLGYWIAESRKMAYKTRFRPVEILTPHGWQDLPN